MTNEAAVIAPTVHLNGTSRSELERQLETAAHAVAAALKALSDAAPNARDYYVQGDRAFAAAQAEHSAQQAQLRDLYDNMAAKWEAVVNQ